MTSIFNAAAGPVSAALAPAAGIAQTLVSLGMGLDALQTVGDLGQALDLARAASQLDR